MPYRAASNEASLRDADVNGPDYPQPMNRWASASLKTFDRPGASPHAVYVQTS